MSKLTKLTSTSFGRRGSAGGPRFNWTLKSTVTGLTGIDLIRYRGGLYYAFGPMASGPIGVYSSPDLINWTLRSTFSGTLPEYSFDRFQIYGFEYFSTGHVGGPLFLGAATLTTSTLDTAQGEIFAYGNPPGFFGGGYTSPSAHTYFGCVNDGTNFVIVGRLYQSGDTFYDPVTIPFAQYGNTSAPLSSSGITDNRSQITYPSKGLNDVASGGGVVVVVGNYDYIAYSTNNGVSFTNVIGTFTSGTICGVAYGNGKFICVTTDGRTATSTNGSTWTLGPTLSSNLGDKMMFAQGTFIVRNAANIFYSTNGALWQSQAALAPSLTSTYEQGNALVVNALSDGRVYTSA